MNIREKAGRRQSLLKPGVFNRYYDPATDQFLSVDPDVAETDQPYVFTNDDPLNATDPRGLQGSSGLVASQDYRNAVAKKCDGHPDRDGCRGVNVVKDISSAYSEANNFANHVVIGFGGCFGTCVNVSLQGTYFTGSIGGTGVEEKGLYVGYSNLKPGRRQQTQDFISGGFGAGGSAQFGVKPNGTIDRSDREVDAGQISGAAGGLMWSKTVDLWP